MNTLRFHFAVDSGAVTLRPIIDGLDLLRCYQENTGLHPERLLPPLSSLLLPTGTGRRVLIGACSCGETGCGALAVRVHRLAGAVFWEPDEDGREETLSRAYRFDLLQYLDALDEASLNRPGEGRGSRVARRVRLALGLHDQRHDTRTLFQAVAVDWIAAWPWDSGAVRVSLTSAAGQELVEFAAGLDESDEEFTARVVADINARRYAHHDCGGRG